MTEIYLYKEISKVLNKRVTRVSHEEGVAKMEKLVEKIRKS
ncbi:MAG TPA: hypothetical protein VI979_04060 [archaeon]|nr:hypothetical protein [archaeon]